MENVPREVPTSELSKASGLGAGDVGGLVIRAGGGDTQAWDELVERFADLVRCVAEAHGLEAETVAIVTEKVWAAFARELTRIRKPDRAGIWLGAVVERDESARLVNAPVRRRTLPKREAGQPVCDEGPATSLFSDDDE